MAKKPASALAVPPGMAAIRFEAALPASGNVYAVNGDGEAKLSIVVSASAARPLADAMAVQALRDTTFIVTILYPDPGPPSSD